jgi:hypothetical protein
MLYGRRYVKVVETVEGNGVVHHLDVDSSDAPYSVVAPSWTTDGIFRVFYFYYFGAFLGHIFFEKRAAEKKSRH